MKDSKGAIADYSKAVELNHNYKEAYLNMAFVKYNIKDLQGALEDCNKAIAIFPNYESAINLKTDIEKELNNIKQ